MAKRKENIREKTTEEGKGNKKLIAKKERECRRRIFLSQIMQWAQSGCIRGDTTSYTCKILIQMMK